MNKIILSLVVVVVVVGAIVWVKKSDTSPSISPSVSVSPKVSLTATPKPGQTFLGTPIPKPSATPTKHSVAIQDFVFSPASLTVKKGDIITFTNKDSASHTVTSLTSAFNSGTLSKNESFALNTAILAPGSYEYKCNFHSSMRGTLVVQ